jgi:hypothetical protein
VSELWLTLLPLIAASALTPVQTLVTLLLLRRRRGGVRAASAFITGMATMRLLQGLLFALLFPGDSIDAGNRGAEGAGPVEAGILIVLALLLYATAVQQALSEQDPDDPPPKWLVTAQSMSATRAYLVGIGLVLLSGKLWIFSLGVVGAVRDSGISTPAGVLTFLIYVVLSAAIPLLLIAMKLVAPDRSSQLLETWQGWLEGHKASIVIALSLLFGTWFLLTGLSWLDVI